MRNQWLFVLVFVFGLPVAHAGQMVEIAEGPRGYFAVPQGEDPTEKYPGVLLIHEWWGLNDQMKLFADHFAERGFAAFAVDLYEGQVTTSPGVADRLMQSLSKEGILKDLKGVLTFFGNHPDVEGSRVGVIGWSMGGELALWHATQDWRVRAVAIHYGKIFTNPRKLENLGGPVLGIFGARDPLVTREELSEFEFTLNKLGKRHEIHLYPGVGHGFINPQSADYHPSWSRDAWKKTLIFLRANLA